MIQFKSDFLNILNARGFIHQCSDFDALDAKLMEGPQTAYVGYDATARSLHVGNLLSIMMLKWFQTCGHIPITLMGGGTTKVGDPSGKDKSRKLLDEDGINANIEGIKRVFGQYLDYPSAIMVNNDDWLKDINYISFLRDYGRHFSVNRMLSFDSVKLRLEREQPLSFLEFNYMILQAYDFLELNRRHGTILQMGGSDQWGNSMNGVELARRTDGVQLFALTVPLLTTASGTKMGKTAQGAVWLNADMLSPYDYYQFWRNAEDVDIGRFLRLYTMMDLGEIAKLETLQGSEINEAKKVLALEATALCHGRKAAEAATETARRTFEEGRSDGYDLPSIDVPIGELADGIALTELITRAGLAASNGEARRLIKGGGARVNDAPMNDDKRICTDADINNQNVIKISAGKKKHVLVRVA